MYFAAYHWQVDYIALHKRRFAQVLNTIFTTLSLIYHFRFAAYQYRNFLRPRHLQCNCLWVNKNPQSRDVLLFMPHHQQNHILAKTRRRRRAVWNIHVCVCGRIASRYQLLICSWCSLLIPNCGPSSPRPPSFACRPSWFACRGSSHLNTSFCLVALRL